MTQDSSNADDATAVFQHETKQEWGAAVVVWERDAKRGYQFEDGAIRVFTAAYYHLMESIDVPADRVAGLLELAGRAGDDATSRSSRKRSRVTLDQQIDYLLAKYSEGFAGELWIAEHRQSATRRLKRHRDPTITAARELLGRTQLEASLDAGEAAATLSSFRDLLEGTDLMTTKAAGYLRALQPHAAPRIITALSELLWGDAPFGLRFQQWVGALTSASEKPPTWLLATTPLALVHPSEHVCIHPTTFHAQAAWLAPQLRLGSVPQAPLYSRALRMVERIRDRACERDAAPADLFDVYDFMSLTFSAKARAEIEARSTTAGEPS